MTRNGGRLNNGKHNVCGCYMQSRHGRDFRYTAGKRNERKQRPFFSENGDVYAERNSAFQPPARSKGMAKIAESSGLGRESLYKALDENSHPRFETVFKVLAALGIQMHLVPRVKFKRKGGLAPFAVAEKRVAYKA